MPFLTTLVRGGKSDQGRYSTSLVDVVFCFIILLLVLIAIFGQPLYFRPHTTASFLFFLFLSTEYCSPYSIRPACYSLLFYHFLSSYYSHPLSRTREYNFTLSSLSIQASNFTRYMLTVDPSDISSGARVPVVLFTASADPILSSFRLLFSSSLRLPVFPRHPT